MVMTKQTQKLDYIRNKIRPVLQEHEVVKAEIFGSYAREEQNENSDIDILVELEKGKTLVDLAELKKDLEKVTEKEVDVLTYNSVNSEIREKIFSEAIKV